MDFEKLNYCVENIEECESHKKDSKHKKYRKQSFFKFNFDKTN